MAGLGQKLRLCALTLLLAASPVFAEVFTARVVGVSDGDTMTVLSADHLQHKIRVGGLVGGGVAAGAALTGGLAIVVGLAAYQMLSSERRDFEAISPLEQRIVQSCWMLAAVADAYQKRPYEFTPEAAGELLGSALIPLHRDIEANVTRLCIPLDGKHAVAMRQHVLGDFRSAVIERFAIYLSWAHSEEGRAWHGTQVAAAKAAKTEPYQDGHGDGSDADVLRILREGNAEAAIGGVFAALLTRSPLDDSTESRLVLAALRRTSTPLNNESPRSRGDSNSLAVLVDTVNLEYVLCQVDANCRNLHDGAPLWQVVEVTLPL